MWWCFEVWEEMDEKVVRIACAGVKAFRGVRSVCEWVTPMVVSVGRRMNMTVGENHYLVDAEDGEGARYVPDHWGAEFVGLGTKACSEQVFLRRGGNMDSTYLAIILPGRATLTVHSRPLVGWNTAVGLEVSISLVFEGGGGRRVAVGSVLASDRRFRF
jgi:hypothetical protein